jgi:TetR/AcrR family transcriptional regulator, regulator of autoinduction and epiphytic fitness
VPEVKPPVESRRTRSARATRRRILDAAHALFVEQGYATTTVQQIAERADVAWQTVYAVFGNKPAILSAVFDVTVAGDDEPVPILDRPFVQQIDEEPDPHAKLAVFARHLRTTGERTAAIMSVIEAAGATDPEIAQLWRTLQDQRRSGLGRAAARFHEDGILRPGLSVDRAADVLWFFSGPWAFRELVTGRGWSPDDFETWAAATLAAQLLP